MKMKKAIAFIAAMATTAVVATVAFAQAPANFDAALGELGGLGAGAAKNLNQPESYVPKYNTEQAGNGDLYGEGELIPTGPGSQKISNCSTSTADSDLYKRQECEAINFEAKNRTIRPNITVSNTDPVISGNRAIVSDPTDTLAKYKWIVPVNADGSVGSIPAGTCSATSIFSPPVTEERRCTFYKGAENFLCQAPLKVTVVPQFNYQCQDTLGVNKTEVCSKILKVSCTRVCAAFASAIHPVRPTGNQSIDNAWGKEVITIDGPDSNRVTKVSVSGSLGAGAVWVIIFNTQDVSKINYIKIISAGTTLVGGGARGIPNNSFPSCKDNRGKWVESHIRDTNRSNQNGLDFFGSSPCLTVGFDFKEFLVNGTNKNIYNYSGSRPLIIEYQEKEDPALCPAPTCTTNWDNQCSSLEDRAK